MSWSDESTWPWWRTRVARSRYSVGVSTTGTPATVTCDSEKSTRICPSSKETMGSLRWTWRRLMAWMRARSSTRLKGLVR